MVIFSFYAIIQFLDISVASRVQRKTIFVKKISGNGSGGVGRQKRRVGKPAAGGRGVGSCGFGSYISITR